MKNIDKVQKRDNKHIFIFYAQTHTVFIGILMFCPPLLDDLCAEVDFYFVNALSFVTFVVSHQIRSTELYRHSHRIKLVNDS